MCNWCLFSLGSAGLGALASGAADVVVGDPALVVAGGGGGRIGGGRGDFGLDLLDFLGGARSALGLGEEGLDPGLVDKVEGTSESGRQDEVEEDAANTVSTTRTDHTGEPRTHI